MEFKEALKKIAEAKKEEMEARRKLVLKAKLARVSDDLKKFYLNPSKEAAQELVRRIQKLYDLVSDSTQKEKLFYNLELPLREYLGEEFTRRSGSGKLFI